MNEYQTFIESKKHRGEDFGILPSELPDCLFDYQKHIADKQIRKGRSAGFIDTGLGKTLIELVTAQQYLERTNKRVLIITPLAVAYQFLKEAEKFDIADPMYSRDGKLGDGIVICNYERLDKFDPADFDCVILDESSILKNFNGATKTKITKFLRKVKYRYLFTATPSPNDFIELGTSSEALGYMGYTDMLTKFFTNNEDTISPQSIGAQWVLKGHARESFFEWVSSWSISVRKPSDIGFSDDRHVLPNLVVNDHTVRNQNTLYLNGQSELFVKPSTRLTEARQEQSQTVRERCELAASIASGTLVYWCNLNAESALLNELDPDAVELVGSMPMEKKEEILIGFQEGQIERLITKPKITCFGLNWQHCDRTIFFPTFSYEQYYQAVRRFWRFGQPSEVTVDRVFSEGQGRILTSLDAKAKKADEMFTMLNNAVNQYVEVQKTTKPITRPRFL